MDGTLLLLSTVLGITFLLCVARSELSKNIVFCTQGFGVGFFWFCIYSLVQLIEKLIITQQKTPTN